MLTPTVHSNKQENAIVLAKKFLGKSRLEYIHISSFYILSIDCIRSYTSKLTDLFLKKIILYTDIESLY